MPPLRTDECPLIVFHQPICNMQSCMVKQLSPFEWDVKIAEEPSVFTVYNIVSYKPFFLIVSQTNTLSNTLSSHYSFVSVKGH